MAYSELIKDISRIRDYMREFFVYGFKSREEIGGKSARSYDNERRRIESWLGDYMSFHQDANGKNIFISVDSRHIPRNPLFQMWRAASFTKNDITLHFWLMDILSSDTAKSLNDIITTIDKDYLPFFENADPVDESTLRKKLNEYVDAGLIKTEKQGKQLAYKLPADDIDLDSWRDGIEFFTGENPVGVIGSFLQDMFADAPQYKFTGAPQCKLTGVPQYISFKHNYLLFATDCGIMLELLDAINEHRTVELSVFPDKRFTVVPLKIYISTQGGRQYIACCSSRTKRAMFFRLDAVQSVKQLDETLDYDTYMDMFSHFRSHLWGVSTGKDGLTEHIEVVLKVDKDELYIVGRLEREKRCGNVTQLSDELWQFDADVYDAQEMLPWIRTFTGRIISLTCTNKAVEERFHSDIAALSELYGSD